MPLLDIKGLSVQFEAVRRIHAVEGVDLSVEPRTCVAIVGESGSGKSQLLLACTGLLAANGRATGSVCYDGLEILGPGDPAARIRGRGIGFVFQDASGSLTPHRRIGEQLVEAQIGDAKLVRVWRDPARPWRWRERPIGLYELLSAPFVVVIGRQDRYGRIIATRVEVPVIPSE